MKLADFKLVSGKHTRKYVPITAFFKLSGVETERLAVQDLSSGMLLPAQAEKADGGLIVRWIQPLLDKDEVKRMRLLLLSGELPAGGMRIVEEGGEVKIYSGDFHVASIRHENVSKPYVYPLNAPNGLSVTEDGPKDHVHHRSLWVAHGEVNGVDVWSELEGHGYIRHKRFSRLEAGSVYAFIEEINVWTDAEGRPLLDEVRRIRFWNMPTREWLIDFEVELLATYGDVVLGDTKEAGILSVRVAPTIRVDAGGELRNSWGGVNEEEVWGQRAAWCDYSGPLGGEVCGISVMDHPGNPRSPTYWHARNYGLMTANIFGLHHFTGSKKGLGDYFIKRGAKAVFKYRVYVHRGNAVEAGVGERYLDYVYPPKVIV